MLIRADGVVERNLEGDLISGCGVAAYFHNSLNFQILYMSQTDNINTSVLLLSQNALHTSLRKHLHLIVSKLRDLFKNIILRC